MTRRARATAPDPFGRLGGRAPAIQALRDQIRRLAGFDAPGGALVPTLLVQGETGTGKGLVARIVHDSGPRAQGPFVAVNCAAIPETMLEAELFGYEVGAFTDAKRAKPGLFEAAARGTLFLDEIDSLSLALQAKLLTALESKRTRRLGAVAERAVDVKLIAATQHTLAELAAGGAFRPDLYHRLAVVVLALPPLRDRGEDVLELAQTLLEQFATGYGSSVKRLTADAMDWLRRQAWPGNVRELGHLMERATLLHLDATIDAQGLAKLAEPGRSRGTGASAASGAAGRAAGPVDEVARLHDALVQAGGNVVRAARLLGISRDTMRYRMRRHGIERPDLAAPSAGAETVSDRDAAQGSADRAQAGGATGWQQKPVSVVAIELTWPAAADSLAPAFEPWSEAARWDRAIQEKLEGLGGALVSHTPSLMLWAFGIPWSIEELVPRAVHAALAVRNLASRPGAVGPPPNLRIAVHEGAMLVDPGAPRPAAAALPVGATLSHLVDLLAHTGVGEVLASEAVASALGGWVHVEPLALAGSAETLTGAHRILGLVPPAERARVKRALTPFVGRAQELEALVDLARSATSGSGLAVGVIGAPGIGKSRLLRELGLRLAAGGIRYGEADCHAAATMTPYVVLGEAVSIEVGLAGDTDAEAVRDALAARLATLGIDADRHLPFLLALLLGMAAPAAGPEDTQVRIFEAAREVLLAGAHREPLVLAVENAHWIDPTSEQWLASLADSLTAAPLCLVVTYRPGYRPAWIDRGHATQIALRPLGPAESRQLVRSASGPAPLSEAMEDSILDRGEGNPFFLEELVRAVRAGGDTRVPNTVRAVLAARMDRLSVDDRHVLQAAAVLGRDVPLATLEHVVDRGGETLRAGLERLQAVELLLERPTRGEPAYVFAHALTQAAAYDALPAARRQALHLRAVSALTARAGARQPEWLQSVAEHAAKGEDWPLAAGYFRQAADAATARGARREAAKCCEAALDALAHLPEDEAGLSAAGALHFQLAEARYALGELGPAREHLALAQDLGARRGDAEAEARALLGLLHVATAEGNHDEAIEAGERVLATGRPPGDRVTRIWAGLGLARVAFAAGQYRRGIEHGRATIESLGAESDDGPAGVHWLLRTAPAVRTYTALCLARTGDFEEAVRHGEDAVCVAERSGSPIDQAWAHYGLGRVHHARTDFSRAIPHLEQALALLGRDPSPVFLTRTLAGLASTYAQSGRVAEALPLLARALAVTGAMRFEQGRSLVLVQLGETHLSAGRAAEAEQQAHAALEMARVRGERGNEAWALHLLGAAARRREPSADDEARDWYARGRRLAADLEMRPLIARARLSLGALESEAGRPVAAREHLESAAALCRDMAIAVWLAEAERLLAHVAARGPDA